MLPDLGRQYIRAELQETGGLSATSAVNRLGRCRATRPRFLATVVSTGQIPVHLLIEQTVCSLLGDFFFQCEKGEVCFLFDFSGLSCMPGGLNGGRFKLTSVGTIGGNP